MNKNIYLIIKENFLNKNFNNCLKIYNNLNFNDNNFNYNIFLKNIYLIELLNESKKFNFLEFKKNFNNLENINNENLKNLIKSKFLKNISLFLIKQNKFDLSFLLLDICLKFDSSIENIKLYESLLILTNQKNKVENFKTIFSSIWYSYINNDNISIINYLKNKEEIKYNNFLKGISFFNLLDFQKSFKYFKKSLKENFRKSDCYNFLGICLYYLNKLNKSLKYFEKSFKFNNKNISNLYNISIILKKLNLFKEEKFFLEKYIQLYTIQNQFLIPLNALINLLKIYLKFNQFTEIISLCSLYLKESKKIGFKNPSIEFFQIYLYCLNLNNDINESLIIYNILKNENSILIKKLISNTLFNIQYYSKSEELINNFNDFDSLANKSIFYFLKKNLIKSFEYLEISKKLNPKNKNIMKIYTLFKLSSLNTIKSGYFSWLSFLGFPLYQKKLNFEENKKKILLENDDKITKYAINYIEKIFN